jgi:hypothetical protein
MTKRVITAVFIGRPSGWAVSENAMQAQLNAADSEGI